MSDRDRLAENFRVVWTRDTKHFTRHFRTYQSALSLFLTLLRERQNQDVAIEKRVVAFGEWTRLPVGAR